ncbi:MAG TPA: hypothetical protein VMR70_18565 [Flavisolibacter sp.]|nr:hypothetical protein [Flavisolibacter sp.]
MTTITQNWWLLFIVCFTVMLGLTLWLAAIARNFYTNKDGLRSFSIFDLEFAATESMLDKIFAFSTEDSRKQLRRHLLVDFLFMPFVYGGIALLCYKTALKMEYYGYYLFMGLAALQLLPFVFDVLENSYLMGKLTLQKGEIARADSSAFKQYQFFVKAKFTIALTGTICSVFGLFYFWLVGTYAADSLIYLAIIVAEIMAFLAISRRKKPAATLQPDLQVS